MYKFQNLPFMKIPSIQPCMETLNINLFFSFFFWEGNSAVSLMWLINGHAPTCVSHSYMFLDPPVKARSAGWRDCVCLQQDKAWLHHMYRYSPHILTMRQSLTQACKTVQGVIDVYVCLTGDAVTDPTVNWQTNTWWPTLLLRMIYLKLINAVCVQHILKQHVEHLG